MELSPFWFGLYKLVKLVVYPYTWLCVITGVLAVLAFLPSSPARLRWLRLLAAAALAIAWLTGSPIISTIAAGFLESRALPFDRAGTERYDAVVVLGAGIMGKGSLRPADQLTGLSMQRTLCGADLFTEGRAPRLVLSGGDGSIFGEGPKEAIEMKNFAVRLGVPENAILLDDRARTTYENAVGTKRVLGPGSILLVTSASHIPRAAGLFRKQGFTVTPASCNYVVREWPWFWSELDLFDFIPSLGALDKFTNALTEAVGTITYWATGKL
ncbi:MAG: YdcF family protein [Nitrospiraceae bacterium]|nr:YdcF family protein [Nitrospiraceae bacterium]MSR25326.1 YdcF family protein [Nitrospiraceae bacterium]